MRDLDDLRELKRQLLELVRAHGEEVTEFQEFRRSMLEMNRRHRREAIGMYVKALSRIERRLTKTGSKKGR